jgi:hypothetical protein
MSRTEGYDPTTRHVVPTALGERAYIHLQGAILGRAEEPAMGHSFIDEQFHGDSSHAQAVQHTHGIR